MDKVVEIKALTKAYTSGHEQILVLEELDFHIARGEFVSIVGPSGSGKSTFLNIVGLLDDVYSGEVRLFGRKLEDLDEAQKAVLRLKNIGFVFQFDSLLPEFTVLENVTLPGRIALKAAGTVPLPAVLGAWSDGPLGSSRAAGVFPFPAVLSGTGR